MEPPTDGSEATPTAVNADQLPNGATITDVSVDWDADAYYPIEGQLVVEIDGVYPDTADLLKHLTPPVDGEYWLAYLASGFVEAFVDVGERGMDPSAIQYTDETGAHWLRRASPQLHHEWDDFATTLVLVRDDRLEREAALSLPSARALIARHYNYEATMFEDDHPKPIVLVEAEPADRTVWGPARIDSNSVAHECKPLIDPLIDAYYPDEWLVEIDGENTTIPSLFDDSTTNESSDLDERTDSANTDTDTDTDTTDEYNVTRSTPDDDTTADNDDDQDTTGTGRRSRDGLARRRRRRQERTRSTDGGD